MGQSEKVECTVPISRSHASIRFSERDHHRLLRMDGQTEAGKPLREHRHHPSGVRFPLAANDKIIRKTREKTSALQARLDHVLKPLIQDMMEKYIGQYR